MGKYINLMQDECQITTLEKIGKQDGEDQFRAVFDDESGNCIDLIFWPDDLEPSEFKKLKQAYESKKTLKIKLKIGV